MVNKKKNLNLFWWLISKRNFKWELIVSPKYKHTVQGKSWDHFCASAEGAVSDSVFPSMIAHCGAIGMGRRSTVGWVRPHTPCKWPLSRASPYLLREGRPIGAHLWDSGGQLVSG